MMLPQKLKKGDIFKPTCVRTVNDIIDYLKSLTPVGGNNIAIDRKTNGTIISTINDGANKKKSKGQNTPFLYPFKLQQIIDQQTQQGQISVFPGWVFVQGNRESTNYCVWTKNHDNTGAGVNPSGGMTGLDLVNLANVPVGNYLVVYINYISGSEKDQNDVLSVLFSQGLYLLPFNNDTDGNDVGDGAWIPFFPGIQTLIIGQIKVFSTKISVNGTQTTVNRFQVLDQYITSAIYIQNNIQQQWKLQGILQLEDPTNIIQTFDTTLKIKQLFLPESTITVNGIPAIFNGGTIDIFKPSENNAEFMVVYLLYTIYNEKVKIGIGQTADGGLIGVQNNVPVSVLTPEETQITEYNNVYTITLGVYNDNYLWVYFNGQPLAVSIDTKTVNCTDIYDEIPDGVSDTLRNKLHSRQGTEMTGQPVLINQKQPNDYIDIPYLSAGNQYVSKLSQLTMTSGHQQNGFLYPKWRFDLIPGFDQAQWQTLNFNGLNTQSDPKWQEYGKLRLNGEANTAYFLSDIIKAGQHVRIDTTDNALTFNAINYVQQITGDEFITATEMPKEDGEEDTTAKKYQLALNLNIQGKDGIQVSNNSNTYTISYTGGSEDTEQAGYNGPFKLVNNSGAYKIVNGTGASTSKAFVNGILFQLAQTVVSAGEIYLKMDIENNTIEVVNSSSADTATTVYHYIGSISSGGIIRQQWQGGVIYRTIATAGAGMNIEIGGDLAELLMVEIIAPDAEGLPSTALISWKAVYDGTQLQPGVIELDGYGHHKMWPLTTCPVVQDYVNSQQNQ